MKTCIKKIIFFLFSLELLVSSSLGYVCLLKIQQWHSSWVTVAKYWLYLFSVRRASAALNCLKRFHEMKKRGPKPYSLHLDHIIQKAISTHQKRDQYRVQKDIFILKVLP